jgi:hypothetical protein
MARLLSPPALHPLRKRVVANAAPLERVTSRAPASASIAQIWRESLQTFSTHTVAMLLCILLGLMSPFLVGHWIATQAVLQNYAWAGPVLDLEEKLSINLVVMLSILGWLSTTGARGIISALALQRTSGQAIRETLEHLPALLISTLVYSALMAACLLELSPILQTARVFEQISVPPAMREWKELAQETSMALSGKALATVLPDAGAPFGDVLPAVRDARFRRPALTAYENVLADNGGRAGISPLPEDLWRPASPNMQIIPFASLALLIAVEALLRFRMVLAFEPLKAIPASSVKPGGYHLRGFEALAPLVLSVQFGLRNFGAVLLHGWVLRCAILGIVLVLIELPMAAMMQMMMPALVALVGKTPLWPILHFVQSSSTALVIAIFTVFSTIYDARLFVALREGANRT